MSKFDHHTWQQIVAKVKQRRERHLRSLLSADPATMTLDRVGAKAIEDRAKIRELDWILNLEDGLDDD